MHTPVAKCTVYVAKRARPIGLTTFLLQHIYITGCISVMEIGTNATAKLEPFLLMAKSAKGAAAAKLIQDATSAPGVFVFAELLELPNIQEVRNSILLSFSSVV